MPAMCIALALAIVVVAAIAIVKKLDVRIVLLVAGMALNILALAFGAENILPKGAQSTGLVFFDLFEAFDALSLKQITGTGFIMLLAGGFATYMGEVGASDKLVDLCMKPLSHIKHPYLILVLVFVVGHLLSLVITTAAGLSDHRLSASYPYGDFGRFGGSYFGISCDVLLVPIIGVSALGCRCGQD